MPKYIEISYFPNSFITHFLYLFEDELIVLIYIAQLKKSFNWIHFTQNLTNK